MLNYNGTDTSHLIDVTEITGRGPFSQDIESITVPGRPGSYFIERNTPPRNIGVSFELTGNSLADIRTKVDQLNEIFDTNEPSPIIFEDEPNRMFYGILNGTPNWDEYIFIGKGNMTFYCPDPHKYSSTPLSVAFASELESITNAGAADTYPTFKANAKLPLTHLDIVTDHGYMRIGRPYAVDTTPFEPQTLILHDSMGTLTGWGQASTVDNGYVAGTMASDGAAFYPSSFGTVQEPKMFQGPAMKKSLSESLQDFKMDALVELKNLTGQTGILELYLLDAANNVVGKVGLQDRYNAAAETIAVARAGDNAAGTFFANEKAAKREMWQDYDGMVRIERIGNEWRAYFAVIKDGKHVNMRGSDGSLYHLDVDSKYMGLVSQVQVAFRIYPNTDAVPMKVKDIKVWRINQQEGIPYIAQPGDVIEFDHKTNDIRINGESRVDLKDFGASYFPLKKGQNIIQYGPRVAADLTIEWRERFK